METILILHGAIGSSAQLQPLADMISNDYTVHNLDFTGHGGKDLGNAPFSIELFANDVLQYMQREQLDKVNIFGYSMGGYVAMYLAKHYPEKISKIITLATKYYWDAATADKETKMLDPEKMELKVPAFAATLKERHQPNDWKEVLNRTANMMRALGNDSALKNEDHPNIQTPVLLLLGDRDKMVSLEETVAVYKALPNAMMGMLPATPHPIEQVHVNMLTYMVTQFLQ